MLAAVAYLIKGMFATGRLSGKVEELTVKTEQTSKAVEEIRGQMIRPKDLETAMDNAILKLKIEIMRGSLARETDKG